MSPVFVFPLPVSIFAISKEWTMDYGKEKERHSFCLECGDEIVYGRTDRKFCSSECKNRFNNRKSRNSRMTKLKVIHALEKNHRILETLVKAGVTSLGVMEMKQLGFDFDYMTSSARCRRHNEFCCFDIKYTVTPSKVTSIAVMPYSISGKGISENIH